MIRAQVVSRELDGDVTDDQADVHEAGRGAVGRLRLRPSDGVRRQRRTIADDRRLLRHGDAAGAHPVLQQHAARRLLLGRGSHRPRLRCRLAGGRQHRSVINQFISLHTKDIQFTKP